MSNSTQSFGTGGTPAYPGRVVKVGDPDKTVVKQIERRINELGCGPIHEDGIFDKHETKTAVKLFQTRFTDAFDNPLKADGEVGPLTWGALFGDASVPGQGQTPSSLASAVIAVAKSQVGVREKPLGSNSGPEVDAYLKSVGLAPGNFWCVAFTYWCYEQASTKLTIMNPHVKTGGVLKHWADAKGQPGTTRIPTTIAIAQPQLVTPGALFIIDHGGGFGHSGIVVGTRAGMLITIEGNTNTGGSNNGIGVFERVARKIKNINKGFIIYT